MWHYRAYVVVVIIAADRGFAVTRHRRIFLSLFFASTLIAGVAADQLLGEPRRWHPLVGFGRLAERIEALMAGRKRTRGNGMLAWALAVAPLFLLAILLRNLSPTISWVVDAGLLYFSLGARSLIEHAEAVAAPLAAGDLATARQKVGWMVSRETASLDELGVAKAACESTLENGNDAIFGVLFWFCVFGGPGALLFRLANTLDAMWGYRTSRFLHFGWAAARIDDVLNWIPARLTALTYAFLGNWRNAIACWREQGTRWESPNAGPVMAAGAGALGILLGGNAVYGGLEEERPPLGCGAPPDADGLRRVIRLIQHGVILWLGILLVLALVS